MSRIGPDAFARYLALGPGRSLAAIAEAYGVSKRAVVSRSKREGWAERIRAIEAKDAEKAEAQASRNQLEKTIRDLTERQARLVRQLSDQNRDIDELDRQISALPDPQEKREEVEAAEVALENAETAIADIEDALNAARLAETAARPPVDAARALLNGIETEARTIRRMLEAAQVQGAAPPGSGSCRWR